MDVPTAPAAETLPPKRWEQVNLRTDSDLAHKESLPLDQLAALPRAHLATSESLARRLRTLEACLCQEEWQVET